MGRSAGGGVATAGLTILAPVAWGTTYVVITELLPDDRPFLTGAVRVLPAGAVLVAIGWLRSARRPSRGELRRDALLAACNFVAFFPLLAVAVYRLPGGVAAAVGGLQPLLVTTGSAIVARRRPALADLVVGIVAMGGVALVVLRPGVAFDATGLLAAFGANVAFSAAVVLTKWFPAPGDRLAATGRQLLLSTVALVPLALLVEGAPPRPTGENLAGFAYLSLVATAIAYALWFRGVKRLPPVVPPLLGLAAPVTGAVCGWLILDESLTPLQVLGFVVTGAAIAHGARRAAGAIPVDPRAADQTGTAVKTVLSS